MTASRSPDGQDYLNSAVRANPPPTAAVNVNQDTLVGRTQVVGVYGLAHA